jgi:predicted RNA-binding Zn-ribbon protein involved in translation (DUF1610 family)
MLTKSGLMGTLVSQFVTEPRRKYDRTDTTGATPMTVTKQTELLPCPCCGHPEIEDDESYIMCQNCGLMIDRCDAPNNDYVAAWNRRAPSAAPASAELIRLDFVNADGQPDSKMITHDEMRERYATAISPASDVVQVPRELPDFAIQLCDVLENKDEIPLHKWALKSAYLVGKIRALLNGGRDD